MKRYVPSTRIAAAAVSIALLGTAVASGQSPSPQTLGPRGSLSNPRASSCPEAGNPAVFYPCALEKVKTFKAQRRTSEGKPDMNGIWAPSRGAMDIEEITNQYGEFTPDGRSPRQKSLIVDPANGKIPYQPWAAEARRKISSFSSPAVNTKPSPDDKAYAFVSPSAMCFQIGPQRQAYSGPTQIVQQSDAIYFFKDRMHTHRIIPMDNRPHVGSRIRLWNGDSRGRWEGDTLVVETTNLNGLTWFDHIGTFMSENARLLERFTFIDPDNILYEETVTDPQVFTQPWKIVLALQRSPAAGSDAEITYDDSRENCDLGLHVQLRMGLKPFPGTSAIMPAAK
jgi:hypothetical protein